LKDNTSPFNEKKEINKRKREANNNNNNNMKVNRGKIRQSGVLKILKACLPSEGKVKYVSHVHSFAGM
jgi:hypothetical protein